MQSCRQPRTRPRGADDAAVDAALDPVVGAHLDDPRRQELRGVADFEARGEDRRRATAIAISDDAKASAAFAARSEEHTSELQSLMRISYAVFCLKKKKQHSQQLNNRTVTTTT